MANLYPFILENAKGSLLLKIQQLTDGIGHVTFLVCILVSVSMCIGTEGNSTLLEGNSTL